MGTALSRGYRPYLDIFDHKGPVLFILQMLPQCFNGGFQTITIFLQQLFFLFLCLRIISKISREIFRVSDIIPQLLYISLISSLVGEGNLTEEYSNLFILISLFLFLRFFLISDIHSTKEYRLTAIAIGICFSICFLIRANNALPIGCFTAGTFLFLLYQKKFREIAICASGFILGSFIVIIPVCLWLIYHGALSTSIQASIIHNLLYSETTSQYDAGRIQQLIHTPYGHMALFLFSVCLITSFIFLYRKHAAIALGTCFSAFGALIAAFISHKYYDHYLILGIPLFVVCLTFLFTRVPLGKRTILCFAVLIPCLVWLVFQCYLANSRRVDSVMGQSSFFENAQILSARIPDNELDSVYPYRVEPKWYVAARILPCNRYYFLQETLADANPAVMDEIVAFFNSSPPLWLVIYNENRVFSPPYDARIQEIFKTMYEQIDSAGEYRLMQLREK